MRQQNISGQGYGFWAERVMLCSTFEMCSPLRDALHEPSQAAAAPFERSCCVTSRNIPRADCISAACAAFAGPCTSMRNTVEWAAIIPQDIWQQFDDMTAPQGPVGTPNYNSFCVSHVHLGGSKPGCRLVQHAGLNIPDYGNMNLAPTPRRRGYGYQPARDDFTLRERLVQQYPGSALQAPACRAIAANLMRLNRTGLQASHLLSQLGLNITVHNAMNGECLSLCCCSTLHSDVKHCMRPQEIK